MRLAVLAATAVLAVLLVAPAAARADTPLWSGPPGAATSPMAPAPWAWAPPPPPRRVEREVSYAHQTLIADGIAAAFFIGAARQQEPMGTVLLVMAGVDVYALGAPIVHLANRRYATALKSFGLRMGLPMLGAMIGGKVAPSEQTLCDGETSCDSQGSSAGVAIGALLGATAAVILDAKYLAKKRVTVEVTPMLQASPQGFSAGLGGSF